MKKSLLILVAIILSLGVVFSGCAEKVETGSILTELDTINGKLTELDSQFSELSAELGTVQGQRITMNIEITAEDNPNMKTGVIVLGLYPTKAGWSSRIPVQDGDDLIAHYKFTVTVNGVSTSPNHIFMFVAKKDEVNPSDPTKQFPKETLMTQLTDASDKFVLKSREIIPGVGVLDVYYLGPATAEYVADYVVAITAGVKIGDSTIWATALQDLCVLGWSMDSNSWITLLPDGNKHFGWGNPLGPFASAEEAVFWQRIYLNLPVPSSS